jgi:hypothetical protein
MVESIITRTVPSQAGWAAISLNNFSSRPEWTQRRSRL